MTHIFFIFLVFFGGLLFYALDIMTFKVRSPKIYVLLGFLLSIIPGVGVISYTILYLYDLFHYQRNEFWHIRTDSALLRDTPINRYLFDDVDWETYDRCINKIYEHKEETKENN